MSARTGVRALKCERNSGTLQGSRMVLGTESLLDSKGSVFKLDIFGRSDDVSHTLRETSYS